MAGITERVLLHLEMMEPAETLERARNLERFDYLARRNFRLEIQSADPGPLNLSALAAHSATQIINQT